MPKLGDSTAINTNVKAMGFSPVNLKTLGATEYTLVDISVDDSSSIQGSIGDVRNCVKEIVKACALSPRADNLLFRLTTFGSTVEEFHGFKELRNVNVGDYDNLGGKGGMTALNDASVNGLDAICGQGKLLIEQDYAVNAIKINITDGFENISSYGLDAVKVAKEKPMKTESVESCVSILIGVGIDPQTTQVLQDWKAASGFDEFLAVKDATAKALAKIAQFVSQSISSQSQALGSGGPSKQISNLVSGITI